MKIFDGAVIVWCADEARIFNDVEKADKYFRLQAKRGQNPQWERVFEPVFNKHDRYNIDRKKKGKNLINFLPRRS